MQLEWELWIDTHISLIIAKWLKDETGWDVKSFYALQLNSLDDELIYNKPKEKGNVIIVSKDSDFPNLVNRLGEPPKLIMINLGNSSNRQMWDFLIKRIYEAVDLLIKENVSIVELE
jgi:predicted nuclease of predicted toxin-antitoxin system